MTFRDYCKDRTLDLILFFVSAGAAAAVMIFVQSPLWAVISVPVLMIACKAAAMGKDFTRRRNFYEETSERLTRARYPYLAAEELARPGFSEGNAMCGALARSIKSARDNMMMTEKSECSLEGMIASAMKSSVALLQQRQISVVVKNLRKTVYTDSVIFENMIHTVVSYLVANGEEGTYIKFYTQDTGGVVILYIEFGNIPFDEESPELQMLARLSKALGISFSRTVGETMLLAMEFPKWTTGLNFNK